MTCLQEILIRLSRAVALLAGGDSEKALAELSQVDAHLRLHVSDASRAELIACKYELKKEA